MAVMQFTDDPTANAPTTPGLQIDAALGGPIIIPGDVMLGADYIRRGPDLLLESDDGQSVLIRNYFATEHPPTLVNAQGAILDGALVSRLAGPQAPLQMAQAAPAPSAEPIGQVDVATGEVTVLRVSGARVQVQEGTPVFQGDVIETGADGTIGITFADETTFSLGEDGRMTLDELVYDPATQTGTAALSVVQGVFTFVSGQISKTAPDAMTLNTPSATIGIRGTAGAGSVDANGQTTAALMAEKGGFAGEIVISNGGGTQTLNQPGQAVSIASFGQAPSLPFTMSAQEMGQQFGSAITSLPNASASLADNYREAAEQAVEQRQQEQQQEGEPEPEGEGEGEAEGEAPPEGEQAAEGEGEVPPEGELVEGEGELGPDGEPLTEGELGPDGEPLGEGEQLAEGELGPEGDVPPEGEPVAQGDADIEGEGPQGAPLSGESGPGNQPPGGDTFAPPPGASFAPPPSYSSGIDDGGLLGSGGDDDLFHVDDDPFGDFSADDPFDDFNGGDEPEPEANLLEFFVPPPPDEDTPEQLQDIDNIIAGTTAAETINGLDDKNDLIGAREGNDIVYGHGGNDAISGGAGDDTIYGGTGDDAIHGDVPTDIPALLSIGFSLGSTAPGADTIYGGAGNDDIDGGGGDDILYGGSGSDGIYGGLGADTINGDSGNDSIDGGAGNDTIHGGLDNDIIAGDAGIDTLYGDAGNDLIDGSNDDASSDTYYGDDGASTGTAFSDDFISYIYATDSLTITLGNAAGSTSGSASGTSIGSDLLYAFDGVYSGSGNDTITGNAAVNTLSGGYGNDTFYYSGASDTISGGDGIDTADFVSAANAMTYSTSSSGSWLVADGPDTETLSSIEQITGTAYGDSYNVSAGSSAQVLSGGAGTDTLILTSASGDVVLTLGGTLTSGGTAWGSVSVIENASGSSNNDSLYGDTNANTLSGGVGNDILSGGGGPDILSGGAGNDTLLGGLGNDTLTGGSGSDIFKFGEGTGTVGTYARIVSLGTDTVSDFTVGVDSFMLKDADFGFGTAGTLDGATVGGLTYMESMTAMTVTAVDYNGADASTGAGIIVIGAPTGTAGVELWYSTNQENAHTSNSYQVATVAGINTSDLSETDFDLTG